MFLFKPSAFQVREERDNVDEEGEEATEPEVTEASDVDGLGLFIDGWFRFCGRELFRYVGRYVEIVWAGLICTFGAFSAPTDIVGLSDTISLTGLVNWCCVKLLV